MIELDTPKDRLVQLALKFNNKITVKVTPKAKNNIIKVENDLVKIYVTAVAENDKANQAVIKLLAKTLKIPNSSVSILKGQTSRNKILLINLK